MAKIDFTKVTLVDLEGKKLEKIELHKTVANIIYSFTKEMDLVAKALDINAGKEVDLSAREIEEIKRLVMDEKSGLMAFAKKGLLDILDKA